MLFEHVGWLLVCDRGRGLELAPMRLSGFWSIGAVVSSLAAGAACLALASGTAAAATPHDTVVMAKQIDDIISLDPAESFEVSGQEVIGNLYDRLLAHDPGDPGQVKGDLAQSWGVDDDGLTYRFRLKPGLYFASGNPVT